MCFSQLAGPIFGPTLSRLKTECGRQVPCTRKSRVPEHSWKPTSEYAPRTG